MVNNSLLLLMFALAPALERVDKGRDGHRSPCIHPSYRPSYVGGGWGGKRGVRGWVELVEEEVIEDED